MRPVVWLWPEAAAAFTVAAQENLALQWGSQPKFSNALKMAAAALFAEILAYNAADGATDSLEEVLCRVEAIDGRQSVAEEERAELLAVERAARDEAAALRARIAGTSSHGVTGATLDAKRKHQRDVRGRCTRARAPLAHFTPPSPHLPPLLPLPAAHCAGGPPWHAGGRL